MYGRTFIFVENFHVNNLSVVLEIFMCLISWDKGTHENYLRNLERFLIYSVTFLAFAVSAMEWDKTWTVA